MATKVFIFGGACRFKTTVEAKRDRMNVELSIESECDAVQELAKEIPRINRDNLIERGNEVVSFSENIVYLSAAKRLPHVDCPVPCGILKAVLVEFGLQLKKSPEIKFVQ